MKIENLCKSYGDKIVYENFNLEIEENKVTCILGESGCGKTTLLNVVAGLTPYEGKVSQTVCSYIFQEPRLIPNLTVIRNLLLVCKDQSKALSLLEKAGLKDKANAYPDRLSGGEAQRVAVLRAFLFDAETVLMDEPFSSLDLTRKLSLMRLFQDMRKEGGKTALFVTHDVDECLYLADRIVVLSGGKIVWDVPNDAKRAFGGENPLREKLIWDVPNDAKRAFGGENPLREKLIGKLLRE